MSAALVGHGYTCLIGVENPVVGALNTHLRIPRPYSAAGIAWMGVIECGEDAGTIAEIITFVAGKAGTSAIVS
jgi:hypothetical protein